MWLPAVVGNKKNLFLAASISTLVTKIVMLVVSVILVYHLPEKVHSSPFLLWSRVGKSLNHLETVNCIQGFPKKSLSEFSVFLRKCKHNNSTKVFSQKLAFFSCPPSPPSANRAGPTKPWPTKPCAPSEGSTTPLLASTSTPTPKK